MMKEFEEVRALYLEAVKAYESAEVHCKQALKDRDLGKITGKQHVAIEVASQDANRHVEKMRGQIARLAMDAGYVVGEEPHFWLDGPEELAAAA